MSYKIWVNEAIQIYISKELNTPLTGQIRFRSRIDSCSGTVTTTGCDITINYYWEDINFNSGNASATITGNTVIQSPSGGNEITYVNITSVYWSAGSCLGYYDTINAC
jgi:hypothetical protein